MPRFFLTEEKSNFSSDSLPECIELCGEDAFHLSVSLRARIGDEVVVCTANGLEILCTIASLSGGKKSPVARLSPVSAKMSEVEPCCSVTLFQGFPKGKKTDGIIQKCTELGVSRVVFVYTDHAVPTSDGEEKKLSRLKRIADEAAKQSGRGKLVSVGISESLDEVLSEMKKSDTVFACYEKEGEKSLKTILTESSDRSIAFFVGPEGGISLREVALLQENGIPTVSLGKRILRTETAAPTVLSMILYEKEL